MHTLILCKIWQYENSQIVRRKWCKVAKIAFPRYLSRVISSLNTYVLLKTMINQIGFICTKFLQIRFANVTQFDRPEEMHCTTVVGYCSYIHNQAALGKPSIKKSAVFFNIVQKAFDPPPFYLNICPILQGVFFKRVFEHLI